MLFEVINYREVNQGPLKGRFDVYCRATGVTLREWRHYDGARGESIQGPFQYFKGSGEKVRYHDFNKGEDFAAFQKQILREIRRVRNGGRGQNEDGKTQVF
jgi:hypothetical protein